MFWLEWGKRWLSLESSLSSRKPRKRRTWQRCFFKYWLALCAGRYHFKRPLQSRGKEKKHKAMAPWLKRGRELLKTLALCRVEYNSGDLSGTTMASTESLRPGVFLVLSLLEYCYYGNKAGMLSSTWGVYPSKYASQVSNKRIQWTSTNLIFSWETSLRRHFPSLLPQTS